MDELKSGKEKEPKKDSFAEKMAAQIIKNLQIQIRNIHVRYEDAYTDPKNPFSIGVSLAELLFQVHRFSRVDHQLDMLFEMFRCCYRKYYPWMNWWWDKFSWINSLVFLDNRWKLETMRGKRSSEPDFQGKSFNINFVQLSKC